jgi:hypothetical protein
MLQFLWTEDLLHFHPLLWQYTQSTKLLEDYWRRPNLGDVHKPPDYVAETSRYILLVSGKQLDRYTSMESYTSLYKFIRKLWVTLPGINDTEKTRQSIVEFLADKGLPRLWSISGNTLYFQLPLPSTVITELVRSLSKHRLLQGHGFLYDGHYISL